MFTMSAHLSTSEDILQAIYHQMVLLNRNVNIFNVRLDAIESEIATIKTAFVDNDLERHRKWHYKKESGLMKRWMG